MAVVRRAIETFERNNLRRRNGLPEDLYPVAELPDEDQLCFSEDESEENESGEEADSEGTSEMDEEEENSGTDDELNGEN